jgi:very-short-patch-repair endonuclease
VSRKKHQLARRLRRQATASEKLAWELLRGRRLLGLKFRRQQVIRGYVVDFYCAELRVALEIDGACHGDPGQAEYDLTRTVELWEMGVITLRMWAEDVSTEALRRLFEPIVSRVRGTPGSALSPETGPKAGRDGNGSGHD